MLVKELKANSQIDEIQLEIISKEEPRKFANDRGSGTVCNAAGKDDAGQEVRITLWNEQCSQVNEGDTITIKEGWCSEYKGQIQISAGKKGTLEVKK